MKWCNTSSRNHQPRDNLFSPSQSAPSLFLKSNFEYLRGNYRKAVKLLNSANIAEHPGFMKTGKIKDFHPAGTSMSSIKGLLVDINFKDINDYLTVSALKVMGLYAGCDSSSCTLSHNTMMIFIECSSTEDCDCPWKWIYEAVLYLQGS